MATRNGHDVIVIGAGHAGCEAALASARMGCRTLLLTISLDMVAWMPCNSSIGGPGRGQLVREVDALGGEMARLADENTLHSRRSNTAKGIAVQAPFAILDRRRHSLAMKYLLERTDNLEVRQALIKEIQPTSGGLRVTSVFDEPFSAPAVVLAAGTFMKGEVRCGGITEPAGRYAEVAAPEISQSLVSLGFRLGRFKTGTSPRIAAAGVDCAALEAQMPDGEAEPFSFWTQDFRPAKLPCYKTRTTAETARLVREHAGASGPVQGGAYIGARYCPSIEDRVAHSPEREGHPVFLQPQDGEQSELYIQGLSTSLPPAVQEEMVRSIPGLESAVIMRPGYAVTYDFIYPDQLLPSLETKQVPGLFTAGQVNGSSGYEEAAAQGLIAGINAAKRARGEAPLVLDRSQAYIGVMLDDLVTKGVDEPYRIFTSRAEYRLVLRSDNADLRLSALGRELGLISEERYGKVEEKRAFIEEMAARGAEPGERAVAAPGHALREVEAARLYRGYIEQELKKIERFKALEDARIPEGIDYASLGGLSKEAVEKLSRVRPASIGQAARIPGLRQSDIQALYLYVAGFHGKLWQEEMPR